MWMNCSVNGLETFGIFLKIRMESENSKNWQYNGKVRFDVVMAIERTNNTFRQIEFLANKSLTLTKDEEKHSQTVGQLNCKLCP